MAGNKIFTLWKIFLIAAAVSFFPTIAFAQVSAASQAELRAAITSAGSTPVTVTITDSFELTGSGISLGSWGDVTLITDNPNGVAITRTAGVARHFTLPSSLSRLTIGVEGDAQASNITITSCFADNHAGNRGGIANSGGGTIIMHGGAITNNRAENGGAVFIDGPATFIMNGGEISGNVATGRGGGVSVSGTTASFIMNGGEIIGNTAPNGGGVSVYAPVLWQTPRPSLTIYSGRIAENTGGAVSLGGFGIPRLCIDGTAEIGGELSAQVPESITVNGTLDVLPGETLTIASGTTLNNYGVIANRGKIENLGTIVNGGTIFSNPNGITGAGGITGNAPLLFPVAAGVANVPVYAMLALAVISAGLWSFLLHAKRRCV